MKKKPTIMITFREGGENGGPFNSHKRIMESQLNQSYEFVPLIVPKGRIGVFNMKLINKLKKEIKSVKPDIVHFSGLQLEGFHVALACKLAKVENTVLAIHGSSLEALEFSWLKRQILNIHEIITIKLSYIFYGVSEYVCGWKRVKKYSNKCYGYIYNMPLLNRSKELIKTVSFREEIGVSKEDILITSTGRITVEKGYKVLLDAIKKIEAPQNVKFVIAGDGHYLDCMRDEIKKMNLEKSVYLLGYRKDIGRILTESDIFVMCSLHETLCNSIVEAGYYSLPTVATNIGGIPEIIQEGYNGLLVGINDPDAVANALNVLIFDYEKRKQMGKYAKEVIDNKFSVEKIEGQIDRLYRSVLSNGKQT